MSTAPPLTKKFNVNQHRFDPYRNFKFRVVINAKTVAGVSKVSALKQTTEVVEWREGAEVSKVHMLCGKTKYDPITLEEGLTHDPTFENWAALANNLNSDAAMSLVGYRKDIEIHVLNEQGQVAMLYHVKGCWPSEYQAVPELDANGNAVAIRTLVLQNEGWYRDVLPEPTET